MPQAHKKAKEYIRPAIITAITIFALSFLTNPIAKILDFLISDFSEKATKMLILQLWVGLLIVLFGLLSYIIHLYKKFSYKRIFRFGVYWYKIKPHCPSCGHKLENTTFDFLGCTNCDEKIKLYNIDTNSFIDFKDAVKIIKEET